MSLTNPPNTDTTAAEIAQLQSGLSFGSFKTSAADQASIAAQVNNPGSGVTVFSYAASLIPSFINTSQTAVGLWSLMTGGTPTVADATSLSNVFLPSQSDNAIK